MRRQAGEVVGVYDSRLSLDGCEIPAGVTELLTAAEEGVWPAALWKAVEEAGLTLPLVSEARGGVGCNWLDVAPQARGVDVTTTQGRERFDAVIFGTGFDVDLLDRPETARYTPHIDTWARHVTAQQATANPEPARFPYLGPGFELRSSSGAHVDALARLHLFNWGSTMSHGA